MHPALVVLAAATCIATLLMLAELVAGYRAIPSLDEEPPLVGPAPALSVIIAARDEAATVRDALRSVLAQRYGDFEVIAVDDRSTDGTGEILDEVAGGDPRLRVLHVADLPAGWLGKNHALQVGAAVARGELLLFTDADVVFERSTLARAVALLLRDRLDHLAVGPEVLLRTAPLALVVNYFSLWFLLYMKPWRATDPRSARHIGIGAFNLVRAAVYRAAGMHERIAMRPDDDIELGKLLEQRGARQRLAGGHGLLSVAWYPTLGAMVRGLRKNAFAGLEYSVPRLLGATAATLVVNVWPFVALWTTTGAVRWLDAATAALLVAMYAFHAARQRSHPWLALGYPVAALIFLYALWASAVIALASGGVAWRETRYSLRELRANRV